MDAEKPADLAFRTRENKTQEKKEEKKNPERAHPVNPQWPAPLQASDHPERALHSVHHPQATKKAVSK